MTTIALLASTRAATPYGSIFINNAAAVVSIDGSPSAATTRSWGWVGEFKCDHSTANSVRENSVVKVGARGSGPDFDKVWVSPPTMAWLPFSNGYNTEFSRLVLRDIEPFTLILELETSSFRITRSLGTSHRVHNGAAVTNNVSNMCNGAVRYRFLRRIGVIMARQTGSDINVYGQHRLHVSQAFG